MLHDIRLLINVSLYRDDMRNDIDPEELCRYFTEIFKEQKPFGGRHMVLYPKKPNPHFINPYFIDGLKEPDRLRKAAKDWNRKLLDEAGKRIGEANAVAKERGFDNALEMLKENTEKSCYASGNVQMQRLLESAMCIYLSKFDESTPMAVIESGLKGRYEASLFMPYETACNANEYPEDYVVIDVEWE